MRRALIGLLGGIQDYGERFACSTCVFRMKKGCAGDSRRSPTLIRGKVVQGILCGQAIAVTVADLLENDHSVLVENERRRIRRFVRRIPTESIQVGDLIVR